MSFEVPSDQMVLQSIIEQIDRLGRGHEECARNLLLLQEAFAGNPNVLITQNLDLLQVSLNLKRMSVGVDDYLWDVIKVCFPGVDKNTIRLYISIHRSVWEPDFLETVLYVEGARNRMEIFVGEWGYSNYPLFADIDGVIAEVRRLVALIY
jgi:hypothetical protein